MGIGRIPTVGLFAALAVPLRLLAALARATWDEVRARYLVP